MVCVGLQAVRVSTHNRKHTRETRNELLASNIGKMIKLSLTAQFTCEGINIIITGTEANARLKHITNNLPKKCLYFFYFLFF